MKRGYLLPKGCKDLIDTFKPHHEQKNMSPQHHVSLPSLPPVIGELVIPEQTSVLDLARLLSQKPFQIVADLMQFGAFATVEQTLDFEVISSVARKYGFTTKRAP